jgi:hypothetical protein
MTTTIGVKCPGADCEGRINFPVPDSSLFTREVSMRMVFLKEPQECPECKKGVRGSVVYSLAGTLADGSIMLDIGPHVVFAPPKKKPGVKS